MDEDNYSFQIQEIEVLKSIYGDDLFSVNSSGDDSDQDYSSDINSSCGSSSSGSSSNTNDVQKQLQHQHQHHQDCNSEHSEQDYSDFSDGSENQDIGTKSFNIKVSVDIPKNFEIVVKESQENVYSLPITCLPNINLSFSYPPEYPSSKPPKLFISSCWLSLKNMNSVINHLLSLWEKDELVIFKYVDWIKSNLLEFLSFEKGIVLDNEPIDFESASLWENVSWDHDPLWVSLISVVPTLKSFNSHEGRRQFQLNNQVCSICEFEGNASEFTLFNCHHHICNDCVSNIININIKTNSYSLIKCPEIKCKEPFDLAIVQKFIEKKEDAKKYEEYLKREKGLVKCTRCEKGWATIDYITRTTYCSLCYFSFCITCRAPCHLGVPCDFKQFKSNDVSKNYISQLRVCLCGYPVEKVAGCNKMSCIVCGTKFCWICSKPNIDYDHFGKKCQLFEIPGERNRGGGARGFINRLGAVDATTTCTKCKQIVYRHSNTNSVFCHGCNVRMCFLCKAQIKGTRHFITSSCTQNGKPDSWKPDRTYRFYNANDATPNNMYINQDLRNELLG